MRNPAIHIANPKKSLLTILIVICLICMFLPPVQVIAEENPNYINLTVYIVGEDEPFNLSIKPNEYIGNIKMYLQDQTDVDLNTLDLMHNNGHSNRVLLETKNFYHYNIRDGQTITTRVSENWNYDVVNGVSNTTFTVARPVESNLTVVNANSEFGMSPFNESNYTAFQNAMTYCKANPGTKLVINPGVYYFRGMTNDIALDNLENILIDGQNSEFIFDRQYCIRLTACNGVEFRNLIVDWDWEDSRVGSLVQIENVTPHNYDVRFLEVDEVPDDIPFASFLLYDADELIPGSNGEYRGYSPWQDPASIVRKEKIAPNAFHIEHNGHMYMFEEGDVYLLRHYVYSGRVFAVGHYSRNITFDNVKIYSFTGMGWVFGGKTNHFQILNSYLGLRPREENKRRISTAADAIHVVNSAGYFRIDNNDFSFNGDDVIAVHDDVLIINDIDDSRMELTGWVTAGFVNPGEKVRFKNSQMGEFTDYEATVTYESRDADTNIATIRFSEPLPDDIVAGCYAYNASFSSSNYTITNNYIHESKGRAMVVSSDNALIANNHVYRTVSESIQIRSDVTTGRWTGGVGTNNVCIRDNTFEECNRGTRGSIIEIGISIDGYSPNENVMTNIRIENNTFISCIHNETQNAMDIKNTAASELTITGNIVIDSGTINTNGILSEEQILSQNRIINDVNTEHNYVPVEGTNQHRCTVCDVTNYHDFIVDGENDTSIYMCSVCGALNPDYVAPTDPVVSFAERLYTCALNRECDIEGRDYWVDVLRSGASAADAAHEFLFSSEIEDEGISDSEFIARLYKTFMDRDGADIEINYWLDLMTSGESRETIFRGFVNSPEWANLCYLAYINSGSDVEPTIDRPARQAVIDFATRLYTTCLNREGDEGGIEYWANLLANMKISGSAAAREFFFSDELTDSGISDEEFIARLYKTFMGRDGADVEINYWLTTIDEGSTREDVFNGFAVSTEFFELCMASGINP